MNVNDYTGEAMNSSEEGSIADRILEEQASLFNAEETAAAAGGDDPGESPGVIGFASQQEKPANTGRWEDPEDSEELGQEDPNAELDEDGNPIEVIDPVLDRKPFAERKDDILPGDESDPNGDDADIFGSVGEIMKDEGFLTSFDGEIKSPKDLADALDAEVVSRLTDRQREIQSYMNGGMDLGRIEEFQKSYNDIADITPAQLEENEELSMIVVSAGLQGKGFTKEKADKTALAYKASGMLAEQAVDSIEGRKTDLLRSIEGEKESARQRVLDAKNNETKFTNDVLASFEEKDIFGRKLNKGSSEKLKSLYTTAVGKDKHGHPVNAMEAMRLNDPVGYEQKMTYLFNATNGLKDLGNFDRSAESRYTKSLRTAVDRRRRAADGSGGDTYTRQKPTEGVDVMEGIVDIVV